MIARSEGSVRKRPGDRPPRRERITRESDGRSWLGVTLTLALRAAVNPRLAVDLMRTAWAFRRRRWYARPPFLPLPDITYLRWRMHTAYGSEDAVPPAEDIARFARWRRDVMHL